MSLMDCYFTKLIEGMERKKTRYSTISWYRTKVRYVGAVHFKNGTQVWYAGTVMFKGRGT